MTVMSPHPPEAVRLAQRMLRSLTGQMILGHLIRFELTTEPDQYRVSWVNRSRDNTDYSLVPYITLDPQQFAAWQAWLDARPGGKL